MYFKLSFQLIYQEKDDVDDKIELIHVSYFSFVRGKVKTNTE